MSKPGTNGNKKGSAIMQNRIFSFDSAKAIKSQSYGYLNAIHYMAPASLSGFNLCSHATDSCKALCLGWHSGQAGMICEFILGFKWNRDFFNSMYSAT